MKKYIEFIEDKKIRNRIKRNIGKLLGYGLEGEVYEYGKRRAIKIGELANPKFSKKLFKIMDIAKNGEPGIVKVYEYGKILQVIDDRVSLEDCFDYYYVIMEKLNKTSGWYSFHNYENALESSKIINLKQRALWEKAKKIEKNHRLYYDDLHGANIMETNSGEYKFVDLESFIGGGR